MRIFFKYLFISLLGGFAYCSIEIVWRGRTHYSMFFAGAIVLALFYYISKNSQLSFILKCIIGAVIITLIELILGIVFNLILNENVWNYSNVPLNFLGQICLPFSLAWTVLSGLAFKIIEKINI